MLTKTQLIETLCGRLRLVGEASLKPKGDFAASIGMSSSSFSNLGQNRNPPPHYCLYKASIEYGVPIEYFYHGFRTGFRDADLAKRLFALEDQLGALDEAS